MWNIRTVSRNASGARRDRPTGRPANADSEFNAACTVKITRNTNKIEDKTDRYLNITVQCRPSMQIQSDNIRFALNFDQKH